ncbi:peptide MFS transporter [Ameyamaea chiangmaiensis]|uniref:Peptide MFS transporter n=1 Tax=Ameyamaea chiangmaiensis TaxID=442969 RepID=A0A850PD46_9PROT|nr:peptide MFS transporter [Ameyamaea chiangmaiensis]MBS4074270.1 peptide MFS transporter [Ameyamaea chiangmaiensis]NVN40579.1 peptide MFS transporter [Ameyamaea chiangmaiensis]
MTRASGVGLLSDPRDRGVLVLALTEACERFSFYGMQTLLVLYLLHAVLPGGMGQVVGLTGFRVTLSHVTGPLTDLAFAAEVVALYSSLVYFTPILGGLAGDRLIGQRRAVLVGAAFMAAGHGLMASTAGFLGALGLLIVGSGFLKGNISAQVGNLYQEAEADPRARAFTLFNIGINAGALSGPLACGAAAQVWGWHAGFGLAGIVMTLGLVLYAACGRVLPPDIRRPRARTHAHLTGDERRNLGLLAMVLVTGLFYSATFYQLSDMYIVWIDHHVRRSLGGHVIPTNWFSCLDSSFTVLGSPVVLAVLAACARRGREPGGLGRILAALLMNGAAWCLLAWASATSALVNPLWCVACSALLGTSFVLQWPTTLALVSTLAPVRLRSTLMGVAFLTLFVAYNIVGWIAHFYEQMAPWQFWLLQAAITLAGAPLCLVLDRVAGRSVRGVGLVERV